MSDPRYERAKAYAANITVLANELDLEIQKAARDGYHATIKVGGVALADGVFIGHGKDRATVKATIIFDVGAAVR